MPLSASAPIRSIPGKVKRERLGLEGSGAASVLNVKTGPLLQGAFLGTQGIFPAYHMNKTNWVTIVLETVFMAGKFFTLSDGAARYTRAVREILTRADKEKWPEILFYTYDRDTYQLLRGVHQDVLETAPGKVCDTFSGLIEALNNEDFDLEKTKKFADEYSIVLEEDSAAKIIDEVFGKGQESE